MKKMIETQNLSKEIRGQKILSEVSMEVQKNSVYGLLGPNGAGKSTLLKILSGMMEKTDGEVLFDGQPWKRQDLAKIGALIESPPLYDNLTAEENLKVRTLLFGLPDTRIQEVLQAVDLSNTGKKKAGHFSMGMKERLGIAMALLNHPELLILDEPTNGLDPCGIQDLRDLIRSFPAQGITVILSSHILSEVKQIADHIGILVEGQLWYQDEVKAEVDLEELFMNILRGGERDHV